MSNPSPPRRRPGWILLMVWILVSVGFVSLLWSAFSSSKPGGLRGGALDPIDADRAVPNDRLAWNRPFERFDASDATLEDYRDQPLVVNFWASTCVPCLSEMPEFEEVHQKMNAAVTFLGFNVQDRPEDGRRLAAQTGVTYDLARDPDGSILASFGGIALPMTVLIGADGTVVAKRSGQISGTDLEAMITKELLS